MIYIDIQKKDDLMMESLFCLQQPTVWPSSGHWPSVPVHSGSSMAVKNSSSQSIERSNEVVSRQPKDQSDGA